LFASAWTVILWLREWLLTGFPWNPIANISINFPALANSMSMWGALGLTFVVIGSIASVAEMIKERNCKRCMLPLCVFAILLAAGCAFGCRNILKSEVRNQESEISVRIVQPAKSAIDKASHSREQAIANAEANIKNLVELARTGDKKTDLIVFPETSYPYMIAGDDTPFVKELGAPAIIGATSYDRGRIYNSMAVANAAGGIEKLYHKSHLVPFGEYRPLGDIIPTPGMLTPGGGPEIVSIKMAKNGNMERDFIFVPAICYEIIFTDSLVSRGWLPQAIVNITNDAWFGKTPGAYQHLDMARRYAIESGLPVIRANYSGISAFIAPDGAVVSQLPIGVAGVLDGSVASGHMTAYRAVGRDRWMIIILLFAAACVLLKKSSDKK
jgi:apolipoprotein N-acyltransferase